MSAKEPISKGELVVCAVQIIILRWRLVVIYQTNSNSFISKMHVLCHIILCVLSLLQTCKGLANGAVYTIQNQGTKQCLSAGDIITFRGSSKVTLFKQGLPVSKRCTTNMSDPEFGQQWKVRVNKEDPRAFTYQVQLLMENSQYVDPALKINMRGQFVKYFPGVVILKGNRPLDRITQSQKFRIVVKESAGDRCLIDEMKTKQLKYDKCSKETGAQQMWNFKLVNVQKELYPRTNETSQLH